MRLNIVSCCLIACAFGPYVLPDIGLRLDHLVIYSLFPCLVLAAIVSTSLVNPNVTLVAIMLLYAYG